MTGSTTTSIFEEIGVKPIINGVGHMTMLGGSQLSPRVRAAMDDANRSFVEMKDLLAKSGEIIANLLGAEAAYVTPGCAAALALGTAACIAGQDPEKIDRLPDTTGMKNEVLIQKAGRYKYDRAPTVVGARLVEYGDADGATADQLAAAIGPRTACVHYLGQIQGQSGILPLTVVVDVAHRHGVPVLVDAAGESYPLDLMRSYPASGADLIGYGGKYFGGPNSTGILCGRRDLIESAALQGFIGFETSERRSFGRPFKLDRQEIVAVVVALREWFTLDHQVRLRGYDRVVRKIAERLAGLSGITLSFSPPESDLAAHLVVVIPPRSDGKTAASVAQALRAGTPSIWLGQGDDKLWISAETLNPGEDLVIADRLRAQLSSGNG